MNLILDLFRDALNCVAPHLCECCDRALTDDERLFCVACHRALPLTNFHLQKSNPFIDKFYGRIAVEAAAAFIYFSKKGLGQKLIHQLKYKGRSRLGKDIGQLFGEYLKDARLFRDIDVIIPIPLHYQRFNNRGYNQSDLFARGLSQSLQIPVNSNTVIRNRPTTTQTRKSRIERFENLDGAFNVLQPQLFSNQHILLVDDVLTTGATLEGCAQELLKIEGVRISMATIGFAYFH